MTPRRTAAVVAWTAFLTACVAALHAVGGPLAPPPLSDPAGLDAWLEARLPTEAAVAVARLAALALAWYLVAATVGSVLARLSGAASAVRLADAVSITMVRRLVHGAVGLSIVAGTAGAPPAVADATGEGVGGPPPTMRVVPDADADSGEPAPAPEGPPGPPAANTTAAPDTWTVGAGDHLWGIAERTLAESWGRPPADAEVDPYWRAVIEANRQRLRDPANPDLVFAGQVLTLPPAP